MKLSYLLATGLALTASVVSAAAPNFIAEPARVVAGGRAIQVLVAQAEIKSEINPSNIAVATGGGLLGGLLAAAQDASRAKKAEAAIEPVRAALAGFDADGLALATTKAALGQVAWFQPVAIVFGKDSSVLGENAVLDKTTAAQVAFIEYSYDLSPSFDSVRVVAKLQFANKALPASSTKPEARLNARNLAYAQSITSIVILPAPGDINANAASWSADGAKKARAALTVAFGTIEKLLPRTLTLTEDETKAMNAKDKPRGVAGGFSGRIQSTDGPVTLLWAGGFVHAQPLP